MIVLLALEFLRHRAEEEGGPRFAVLALQPQGPVLVLGFEGLALVPALADQVAVAAVLEFLHVHPGLDADGLAVTEAQVRVGDIAFLDRDERILAGKLRGLVAGGKAGIERLLRTLGLDDLLALPRARLIRVERPLDERFHFGNDRGALRVVLRFVRVRHIIRRAQHGDGGNGGGGEDEPAGCHSVLCDEHNGFRPSDSTGHWGDSPLPQMGEGGEKVQTPNSKLQEREHS